MNEIFATKRLVGSSGFRDRDRPILSFRKKEGETGWAHLQADFCHIEPGVGVRSLAPALGPRKDWIIRSSDWIMRSFDWVPGRKTKDRLRRSID